ncbi:MAG: TlpA disulfide reductase family protein [Rhodanobacter sp.]
MVIEHSAPPWRVSRWFNSAPLTLAELRGRVVVAHAFQMLCPGCAMQALPQMQRVQHMFPADRLAVIGLHTVFEHHEAQGPGALEAFLHEYRYTFPVGVDEHARDDPLPLTMQAYAMHGTPTLILVDAQGRLREQHFGVLDDLALGAALGGLLNEADHPRGLPETGART